MNSVIREYLIGQGYNTVSDETYSHIDEWLEWYENDVKKFHHYIIWNGVTKTEQERYRLGMAKTICEDWANLLLNEKVTIKAGDYSKRLEEILAWNKFRVNGNKLIELVFALGTAAFVEYKDAAGNIIIDYIRADMIYPLSWDNGEITECAFGSTRVIDGKERIYLQIHRYGNPEEGENPTIYYLENKYLDAESGKEIETPETVMPIVETGSELPLFQILTPNICNNIELDSPLGVSVFANGISQLKGCDVVYDSYVNEYVMGRKRILVPISMAKIQMQKDGVADPYFEPNDTVYYMMPGDNADNMKLTEVDMTIRANEHELGIQRCIDLLSFKCGMGTERYRFESGGVKTATEVISDKSDLYQNRQKHCLLVNDVIVNLVRAISVLDKGTPVEATVDFDDSIIEDGNAVIDKNIKLVTGGLRSKISAIMEINKCSEEEAKKELEKIAGDNQITGKEIDWMNDDNSKEDERQDKQEHSEEKEDM
ncbi:MAG: phage portal protein [Blautia hansenii]|nr:phage portal protein [Blautia hansenii]MEE0656451.1 phage portal protein [Blautia hansenii]